MRETA
jgi:nucleotide-binding universal stress UspA family protein